MQNTQFNIEPPQRRGLKPGQRHSGQFQSGHDPKRFNVKKYADGLTFRQLCQEKSPEALQLLTEIMEDPNEDKKVRMAAAIHILDRGYGKPMSGVALLQDHSGRPISQRSNAELDLLIETYLAAVESAVDENDDAVEAEYTELDSGFIGGSDDA